MRRRNWTRFLKPADPDFSQSEATWASRPGSDPSRHEPGHNQWRLQSQRRLLHLLRDGGSLSSCCLRSSSAPWFCSLRRLWTHLNVSNFHLQQRCFTAVQKSSFKWSRRRLLRTEEQRNAAEKLCLFVENKRLMGWKTNSAERWEEKHPNSS